MIIFDNKKLKRIEVKDERFYTFDDVNFFPSVTTILDAYPKGYAFNQWLKDMGNNAELVVKRASEIGTATHNLIERYLKGEKISWDNVDILTWTMFLKFREFWMEYKPTVIAIEQQMISEDLGFAGTLDIVCEINGEIWLIDAKTSNAIHNSYELQIAAYRKMWNYANPDMEIQRTGIFWMKAQTRGADKTGKKIQGEGWQLKEYERNWLDSYDLFEAVFKIWKNENPDFRPKNLIYPSEVDLNVDLTPEEINGSTIG